MDASAMARAIAEGRIRLSRDEVVSVGTTNQQLCKNNPRRARLMAVNLSTGQGWADWRPNPSASRGFSLPQSGGGVILDYAEVGEVSFKEVFAALPAGAGSFQIYEWEAFDA